MLKISNNVRRFHDGDHSGWFCLFYLLAFVLVIIISIFFIKQTPSENQYGSEPIE